MLPEICRIDDLEPLDVIEHPSPAAASEPAVERLSPTSQEQVPRRADEMEILEVCEPRS